MSSSRTPKGLRQLVAGHSPGSSESGKPRNLPTDHSSLIGTTGEGTDAGHRLQGDEVKGEARHEEGAQSMGAVPNEEEIRKMAKSPRVRANRSGVRREQTAGRGEVREK